MQMLELLLLPRKERLMADLSLELRGAKKKLVVGSIATVEEGNYNAGSIGSRGRRSPNFECGLHSMGGICSISSSRWILS